MCSEYVEATTVSFFLYPFNCPRIDVLLQYLVCFVIISLEENRPRLFI